MFLKLARRGLEAADNLCAAMGPALPRGPGSLITVLFHSLYRNSGQIGDSVLAPNQNVTVEDLRRFVGVVLDSGHTVVSPAQVDAGLEPGGNYVMLTFDDGYFNNTLALDVLDEFRVPATFFICSEHVLGEKAFWWDCLSRELAKTGASARSRSAEINRIKIWTAEKIEAHLHACFGKAALRPQSDLDRPFTRAELRDFSRHKWVHLGNHTCDYAILTNYRPDEMARQIQGCQQALAELAGYAPIAISYPNGNYSPSVLEASQAAGLRVGITVLPRRNRLPLDGGKSRMTLGRFLFWGGQDAARQCRKFGSGFIPSNMLKTLIRSAY